MQHISTFVLLLFSLAMTAQDSGEKDLENFRGVAVSSSVEATLVKGDKNHIYVEVDNVDLNDVKVEIEKGILYVGKKYNKGWNINWGSGKRIKAIITYADELSYLSASSSADIVAEEIINSDQLKINVSSSGDMNIEVDAQELDIDVSSSADLNIKGTAYKAQIDASSSADLNGKKLIVDEVKVSASSSADVYIHVNKKLKAKASSSADIVYYGDPTNVDRSSSSGGDIENH
jgi:hypothetical protein